MPEEARSAGALVEAARQGSQEAWGELIDRFSPMVMAVARRYRLGSADVDDVFQVVWLRLAEHLNRIREPERVAGWLSTTTRNEALRIARRTATDGGDIDLEIIASTDTATEELIIDDELRVLVATGFAALGERCRRLLSYLLVKELDYEEVSLLLDMPIGSIGPTRKRCLQKLRGEISAAAAPEPA